MPLSPPTASSAFSAVRSTAEMIFLPVSDALVVAASIFTLFKNPCGSGAENTGPFTIRKSCELPLLAVSKRSPGTFSTFIATARWVETPSGSCSAGGDDHRSSTS